MSCTYPNCEAKGTARSESGGRYCRPHADLLGIASRAPAKRRAPRARRSKTNGDASTKPEPQTVDRSTDLGLILAALRVIATGRPDGIDCGRPQLGPDGLRDEARKALAAIGDT